MIWCRALLPGPLEEAYRLRILQIRLHLSFVTIATKVHVRIIAPHHQLDCDNHPLLLCPLESSLIMSNNALQKTSLK